jgi:purine-binding chemotaxis protein CheW
MARGNLSSSPGGVTEYVTVMVAGQMFGLPIACVHDVFVPDRMTKVPQAPPEIAGVLNLRGRIVTAIDMRLRLGLPARDAQARSMAVGIDENGESYGLLVDSVGEVLTLADNALERNPINLDTRMAGISTGVHRLEGQLLIALDIDRVLDVGAQATAG